MGKSPKQTPAPAYVPVAQAEPPVTQSQREVVQAGMDLRRAELMKKNIRSTIHAGDTGGFSTKAQKPTMGQPVKQWPTR